MPHAKTQRYKGFRCFFASLRLCVSLFLTARLLAATPDPDAAATVVVYNERDASSIELAGYYAEKRGIPLDHLVALSCTQDEFISRADYDTTIAEPLRQAFHSHGWWKTEADLEHGRIVASRIRFVALMRGIPLRVGGDPHYEGDKPVAANPLLDHSEAAVDSELSTLGLSTRQISGMWANPAYYSPIPVPWLLMVCRLDAPDAETVRRMIDDSLAAEKTGLQGFAYVDSRGLPPGRGMAEGDEWMRRAAAALAAYGLPCVLDTDPALFPEHYPMTRAAFYLGWYSSSPEGAFKDQGVRLLPGAVAVHIHSYSAESLRMPLKGWCAPLLLMGAAATVGNVYEPYLTFTPHLDRFTDRLLAGATFAEAAYAAQPGLSWMTTFIGDPLYRPFKSLLPDLTPEYAACREAAPLWIAKSRAKAEPALLAKAKTLQSGVVWEELGLLQAAAGDSAAAQSSWIQAWQTYKDPADQIRCVLHTVGALRREKKTSSALALLHEQMRRTPNAPATPLLKAIEAELNPPPLTPTPSASVRH